MTKCENADACTADISRCVKVANTIILLTKYQARSIKLHLVKISGYHKLFHSQWDLNMRFIQLCTMKDDSEIRLVI